MAPAERLRHVSLGQYLPTGSAVHRLDPRAKLGAFALLTATVLVGEGYCANLAAAAMVLALAMLARLPLRNIWAAIRLLLPVLLVFSLSWLLLGGAMGASPDEPAWLRWGPVLVAPRTVRVAVVAALRLVNLAGLVTLLMATSTVDALTRGFESLLQPLQRLVPASQGLALAAAVAVRFVPVLGEQLEAVILAQDSRGLAPARERWRLLQNARRMGALVVPLFVDAFRRADEIAEALASRCYRGGLGRTRLYALHLRWGDVLALLLSLGCLLIGVWARIMLWP